MAELVDAPDSKSGHFGGMGSIPSTPTNKLRFKFVLTYIWLTGFCLVYKKAQKSLIFLR